MDGELSCVRFLRTEIALRRLVLATVLAATLIPLLPVQPAAAAPVRAVPYVEGPDVPVVVAGASATVTAIADERWSYTAGDRTRTIEVPVPPTEPNEPLAWDRIIVTYRSWPEGDPWDRTFSVKVDDVEVLRGTTPRADFTVKRDITEYASLLPPGEQVTISAGLDSWVGALHASVRLEFAEDTPVIHPASQVAVVGPRGALGGNGSHIERQVQFPDDAPDNATIDVYLSGHAAGGEFWWMHGGPPDFLVYADGTQIATLTAMPYVYALAGVGEGNGPVNRALYWTAQPVTDQAGIHHGSGEIPPYRAQLDAADLALLRGARTIKVVEEGRQVLAAGEYWPISVQFLLNGVQDNCLEVENPDQADADGDGDGDACDGPKLTSATATQDGGALGEPDVISASYAASVSCGEKTDPAQFGYADRSGPVTATAIECEGSSVRLAFPHGTLSGYADDGVLRYARSASPEARLIVDGVEAAAHDREAVIVALSDRPFMTWAASIADPDQPDEVTVYYTEAVDCSGQSPQQFSYDTGQSSTPASFLWCEDGTLTLMFPNGTVDGLGSDPRITYTASDAASHRVHDTQGNAAISPDAFRVAVSIP